MEWLVYPERIGINVDRRIELAEALYDVFRLIIQREGLGIKIAAACNFIIRNDLVFIELSRGIIKRLEP